MDRFAVESRSICYSNDIDINSIDNDSIKVYPFVIFIGDLYSKFTGGISIIGRDMVEGFRIVYRDKEGMDAVVRGMLNVLAMFGVISLSMERSYSWFLVMVVVMTTIVN